MLRRFWRLLAQAATVGVGLALVYAAIRDEAPSIPPPVVTVVPSGAAWRGAGLHRKMKGDIMDRNRLAMGASQVDRAGELTDGLRAAGGQHQ